LCVSGRFTNGQSDSASGFSFSNTTRRVAGTKPLRTRNINQFFVAVEPDNDRVNSPSARNVSADHKFLSGVNSVLYSCAGTFAEFVYAVLPFADDSFQALRANHVSISRSSASRKHGVRFDHHSPYQTFGICKQCRALGGFSGLDDPHHEYQRSPNLTAQKTSSTNGNRIPTGALFGVSGLL
jgi:hypothetical protein